ncbi:WXG100 family type VII secretion target [Kitasatospora kifunensis]|uniref:Uncharacterized protein YukE n=1 Tax=Kitasatospora kifunensis TaxID=58351 RepID=A0A7W7R4V6_KITKI|nr:PPE domain-containing protein [Kitasatospora kifunensis]MBB4925488.1 uncharacterized protein YukE [Kitasatospora kifunensis]
MSSDVTDFNGYSHGALRKMVEALNSGDVMAASDPWRRAADTLKKIRTALDTASGDATYSWQGNTSDAFYSKMTKLATSVNNTAAYANDAANTLRMMSEAIDQAKHDMPEEPGFWSQVGNAISDTAQNAVGIQDDSTQIPIKDQKKAEAVAVMQTLANKYRTATPVLKPPVFSNIDESTVPPPDPTPAAALSAFVMGAGLGAIGGYTSAPVNTQVVTRVSGGVGAPTAVAPPREQVVAPAAPTDSGIKGGVANPAPKPPKSVAVGADAPVVSHKADSQPVRPTSSPSVPSSQPVITGSGTGLDGAVVAAPRPPLAGAAGGAATAGVGVGGSGNTLPMGYGAGVARIPTLGPRLSAGSFNGEAEPNRRPGVGESTFDEEAEGASASRVGGGGLGRSSAARQGYGIGEEPSAAGRGGGYGRGGAARKVGVGGVVGEGEEPVVGRVEGGPRKGFTEGGSGLGLRGRVASEPEDAAAERSGTGLMPGQTQAARRKKRREGKRADYLVEDEESWMSAEDVNPGVVE